MFELRKKRQTRPMNYCTANLAVFERLGKFFHEKSAAPNDYIQHSADFSRNRRLGFSRIVVFLLHMAKKSLSVELEGFFERLGEEENCVTKSALTQLGYATSIFQ